MICTSPGLPSIPGRPQVVGKMLTPKRFRGADHAAGLLYAGDIGSHGDEVRRLFRDSQVGGSGLGYLYQLAAAAGWSSLPFLGLIRQPVLVMGWRCRSDRSGRECTDPGWPHPGRDPACLQRWSCRTAGRSTGFRAGDQPIPVAGAAVSFVRLAVRTSSRAQPTMGTPPVPMDVRAAVLPAPEDPEISRGDTRSPVSRLSALCR